MSSKINYELDANSYFFSSITNSDFRVRLKVFCHVKVSEEQHTKFITFR